MVCEKAVGGALAHFFFFLYSSFISVSWNGNIIAGITAAIMDHEVTWHGKNM